MNERIRKGNITITPEVPSIDLISELIEAKLEKMPEDLAPQQLLKVLWVNRFNNTIGLVVQDEEVSG